MGLVLDTTSPGLGRCAGHPSGAVMEKPALSLPPEGLRRTGLVLRPARLSDASSMVAALDDAEIRRWLGGIPDPYTAEDARSFLCEARQAWTEATAAHFVIQRDHRLVGSIRLRIDSVAPRLGEVGYWVAREARRAGVATTALEAVVDWAFADVGLRRIELHAAVENAASRRVAERAGFQREGIKRGWQTLHGKRADFVLYARLAAGD
jgi:RimJ/RimL family protein N-acetyltransferase